MRTARTAGLVGGLATGALLLAGTAAQAADSAVEESSDLVAATPEALGGLPVAPDQVTDVAGGLANSVTGKVPGLNALPVDAVPGLDALPLDAVVPASPTAEARDGVPADQVADQVPAQDAGNPLADLLSGLGGGLPVPLPF
ncbi:hypothetical protein [Glycomyces sp. NRRL B-16210]|uniref:hypothetical protein n=1 Tax=Glycomyces sp. NRRL B-16210 TaxID=1463821 RepID=UPI001061EEB6|nr:hypothetical protein [Glycomyces sp. NRRL B-16210]